MADEKYNGPDYEPEPPPEPSPEPAGTPLPVSYPVGIPSLDHDMIQGPTHGYGWQYPAPVASEGE